MPKLRINLLSPMSEVTRLAARYLPALPYLPLRAAQKELQRRLQLAFQLASLHRRGVVLNPDPKGGCGLVPVCLPQGVAWGRPPATPLPPRLADSGWTGEAPRPITVMPEHRAAANVWFLQHGRQSLCLCLGLGGTVELLRYRPLLGTWSTC